MNNYKLSTKSDKGETHNESNAHFHQPLQCACTTMLVNVLYTISGSELYLTCWNTAAKVGTLE